jgi:hypothetical protein
MLLLVAGFFKTSNSSNLENPINPFYLRLAKTPMSTNFSVLLNDFTRSNPSMQSINSTYISGSPKLLILLNDILHKISTLQFNPNRSPLHKFYLMHYSILIRLPTFTPYFEDKIIFPYFNYLFCLITYIRLPKLEIYFHFLSSFF